MTARSACLAHSQNVDSSLFYPEECFLRLVVKRLCNPTILHSSLKTNIINVPGVLWLSSKAVLFFLSLSTHNYYSFVLSFLSSAASVPFHGVPGACSPVPSAPSHPPEPFVASVLHPSVRLACSH